MAMAALLRRRRVLFTIFLFLSLLTLLEADECKPQSCRQGSGPSIRFPFRIKGKQPRKCGYPGFDVYCNNNNDTVVDLPISISLEIKKIDYKSQIMHLSDPQKCLVQTLRNLSSSTFKFTNRVNNYKLLHCSVPGIGLIYPVPCLGNSSYAVPFGSTFQSTDLSTCTSLRNILSFPTDIFGNNLQMSWSEPACGRGCEALGYICAPHSNISTPNFTCVEKPKQGAAVGSFVVLTALTVVILVIVKILKERENRKRVEGFLEDYRATKPTRFCYSDIRNITNGFSEKLGEGAYGVVFKGYLSTEISVAVKVLNDSKDNGAEFVNEVSIIGRIHHINVVRLVGFCAEGFTRVIVYDFLPNQSLDKFIYNNTFSEEKVLEIALGIAKALDYLHHGCDRQIIHFDIKPNNILLDQNFSPRICDFGQALLCSKQENSVTIKAARGTIGYMAPELLSRTFGMVSYKSDVYSFGLLLLEMVVRRKNETNNTLSKAQWLYHHLNLGGEGNIAKRLTIVGLHCIQWYPANRPSMGAVVQMLEGDGSGLLMPPNPFSSTNLVAGLPGPPFPRNLSVILEHEENE